MLYVKRFHFAYDIFLDIFNENWTTSVRYLLMLVPLCVRPKACTFFSRTVQLCIQQYKSINRKWSEKEKWYLLFVNIYFSLRRFQSAEEITPWQMTAFPIQLAFFPLISFFSRISRIVSASFLVSSTISSCLFVFSFKSSTFSTFVSVQCFFSI